MHRDSTIFQLITQERSRQQNHIELIASENIVSQDVLEAQGSILTNKYAEGYPGSRYYGGCEWVDAVERIAIERIQKLFSVKFANVQPHSGAQANLAAFAALLKPGDSFMGMSLDSGGHLTHGSSVTLSGKWFRPVPYTIHPETGRIDYDQVRDLAKTHQPRLIIAGGSSYARIIDFQIFREIADSVGAYLMVDMAHFAGLVAGGVYPSPIPHAHIVTTTTHKTLRGPRGGLILWNDETLTKRINSAVFPGCQGGPLMHVIAAKAVALFEALQPSFSIYAQSIVANAKACEEVFRKRSISMVSNGTDSHLLLLDVKDRSLTGRHLTEFLESLGIVCNKNAVPFDPQPPQISSGIRIGTPAGTTRGFGTNEFTQISEWIGEAIDHLGTSREENIRSSIIPKVQELCKQFPIYEM
jgi:glycine hydroxymethyltransferase